MSDHQPHPELPQEAAATNGGSEHPSQSDEDNGDGPASSKADRELLEIEVLRDRLAGLRDTAALERDQRADRRDDDAAYADDEALDLDERNRVLDRHTLRVEELRSRAAAARSQAAENRRRAARDRQAAAFDRQHAARDRQHSARDRELAADDRERAAHDLQQAGVDELTGARRRGIGLEELQREIERARRTNTGLVAAFIDVDDLKTVNDTLGHRAGDQLLRDVVRALSSRLRSYDLVVRVGGDEFLCVLPNVAPAEARRRLEEFVSELSDGPALRSVSFGLSELRSRDSLQDLIDRADRDLLAGRRRRRAARRAFGRRARGRGRRS